MDLNRYLVLNKYVLNLFGCDSFDSLKDRLKDVREGYDPNGRSFYADVLIGLPNTKIDPDDLIKYDARIKGYRDALCTNRRDEIYLKYFQYLSILCSEIFLDRYFNRRKELINELNSFVFEYNKENPGFANIFTEFDDASLRKLAYWMATGSGKTLIMHINYWQFIKYMKDKLDNVILVTPNEGLSRQHYNEMRKSGIPCRLYSENTASLSLYQNEVLIIDIHKLTEEKKGAGVRVEVDYFDGKNLVFIDEGHKGQTTEEQTWKGLREKLGKTGFIFEYSATFGQVIDEDDEELLEEYSKAIIFDYSYKYFYNDGYGKDFYVYNLSERSFQERYRDLILTGNLLSFYEQLLLYEKFNEELRGYQIERPLWAFIGSKVSGAGINSDVVKVVQFLKTAVEKKGFLKEIIEKILNGKSGITALGGNDAFKDKFEFLRENGYTIKHIYEKIFNSTSTTLSISELKSADGEIGLRVGDGEYFGVINIGDVASFKKLLTGEGIDVKQDNISPSLFENINDNSKVNVLIGAKKFIEGWDSWRVCSMGLINMGKGEGAQIIQLFGRGVRLKGKNFSLKRSQEKKYQIKALETLNIFGLNADYMHTFLDKIKREEVEFEEMTIPIRFNEEKKYWKKLYTLETSKRFDFTKGIIPLEIDKDILRKVKIDIRPRIKYAHGLDGTAHLEGVSPKTAMDRTYTNLLNWDNIYVDTLNYKVTQGYFNLRIDKPVLKDIIEDNGYEFYALPEQVEVKTFEDLRKIYEITLLIVEDYIDNFYNFRRRTAVTKELRPSYLIKDDENFRDYTVRIPKDAKDIIKLVGQLLKDVNKLYKEDKADFPRIHFDKHLYSPLLVRKKDSKSPITSNPPQINDGEAQFVCLLRDYLKANADKLKDQEVFILRNLSKRGVEFFQTQGYYPDFILWKQEKDKQTIVFIDPKGIRHVQEEKIALHKTIKELEKSIGKKNIRLESFIMSVSKYDDIKQMYGFAKKSKADLEKEHVLFIDGEDVICKLFNAIV